MTGQYFTTYDVFCSNTWMIEKGFGTSNILSLKDSFDTSNQTGQTSWVENTYIKLLFLFCKLFIVRTSLFHGDDLLDIIKDFKRQPK